MVRCGGGVAGDGGRVMEVVKLAGGPQVVWDGKLTVAFSRPVTP